MSGVRNACTPPLVGQLHTISLSKLKNFSRTEKFQFLRGSTPLTRHILPFDIPVPTSTLSEQLNEDKTLLRKRVLKMHQQGMSYDSDEMGFVGKIRLNAL
jgi:hypothetical protein